MSSKNNSFLNQPLYASLHDNKHDDKQYQQPPEASAPPQEDESTVKFMFMEIKRETLFNCARLLALYVSVEFFIAMRLDMPNAFKSDYINSSFALKLSVLAISIWVLFKMFVNFTVKNKMRQDTDEGTYYKWVSFLAVIGIVAIQAGVWASGYKAQVACAIIIPFLLFAGLLLSDKYASSKKKINKEDSEQSSKESRIVNVLSSLFLLSCILTPLTFFTLMNITATDVFHSDYLNPSFGIKMTLLTFTFYVVIQGWIDVTKNRPKQESNKMKKWQKLLAGAGLVQLGVGYGVWATGEKAQLICSIISTIALATVLYCSKSYSAAAKKQCGLECDQKFAM